MTRDTSVSARLSVLGGGGWVRGLGRAFRGGGLPGLASALGGGGGLPLELVHPPGIDHNPGTCARPPLKALKPGPSLQLLQETASNFNKPLGMGHHVEVLVHVFFFFASAGKCLQVFGGLLLLKITIESMHILMCYSETCCVALVALSERATPPSVIDKAESLN